MNSSGIKRLQAIRCFIQKGDRLRTTAVLANRWRLSFLLFAITNCLTLFLSAQEEILINGKPCDLDGNAKRADVARLNLHKNRYVAPAQADFQTTITLDALLNSGDPNQFSQEKAAVIRGYVYDIKMGGVETCNCKAREPQYRDTHIELTPDAAHTDPRYRVIVEVTPRQRMMMASRGVDWSTTALRKAYKGKWVEVAGWLTYDDEHETAAFANDPDNVIGERNWRATCWEVHPVTYIKPVKQGAASALSTILREQVGPVKTKRAAEQKPGTASEPAETKAPSSSGKTIWLVVGGLVVLVLVYFLLRKNWP